MRTKCLSIIQKYVLEVSQNIDSLNHIGGQNFAIILHNYEKKMFDLVLKIVDSQVSLLGQPSNQETDLPAQLLVQCLQPLRVSK